MLVMVMVGYYVALEFVIAVVMAMLDSVIVEVVVIVVSADGRDGTRGSGS